MVTAERSRQRFICRKNRPDRECRSKFRRSRKLCVYAHSGHCNTRGMAKGNRRPRPATSFRQIHRRWSNRARSITRRPVNRTARSSLHPVQTGPTARLPLLRKRPPSRQLSYLFQPSFGPVRIERSIADNLLLPIPYPMHNNAVSTPKCFSRRNYTELQYRVLIDDNAHYMDESEHAARGVFGSATFAR